MRLQHIAQCMVVSVGLGAHQFRRSRRAEQIVDGIRWRAVATASIAASARSMVGCSTAAGMAATVVSGA